MKASSEKCALTKDEQMRLNINIFNSLTHLIIEDSSIGKKHLNNFICSFFSYDIATPSFLFKSKNAPTAF